MASKKPEEPTIEDKNAVFTTGSTMRHVLVMSSTGAVGLVAIFFVDILNLFYISLLGEQALAAAIGYAATIMFFSISVCIGLAIAATAITARALGAGDELGAKRKATSALVYMVVISILMSIILFIYLAPALTLLGATGGTHQIALEFMQIVVPSIPFLGVGMCFTSLLRARGDAKRAMFVTLGAGMSAAVIDPLLIFGFDMGITGAAYAVLITRAILVLIGWHGVWIVHRMLARPDWTTLKSSVYPFLVIGVPAVLTQIATPFGNGYVTSAISEFGDDAVAGWAVVGRLQPLVFAAVFSLSGAVGPILSQNYGALKFDRINQTMRDALLFTLIYCCSMWAILILFSDLIVGLFNATNDAASLITFFCYFVAGTFIFNGALFTANAAFNNLGNPIYSTVFNWGRATVGIIPFVYIGKNYGPEGVLAGWGIGGVVFGIVAVIACFATIKTLPQRAENEGIKEREKLASIPAANSAFTTGKGSTIGQ